MAVMNQRTGTSSTDEFIERLHDIRQEAYEARMKRLGQKDGPVTIAKSPAKQVGLSFKSGQDAAFASKFGYSFMGGGKIQPGKTKKK